MAKIDHPIILLYFRILKTYSFGNILQGGKCFNRVSPTCSRIWPLLADYLDRLFSLFVIFMLSFFFSTPWWVYLLLVLIVSLILLTLRRLSQDITSYSLSDFRFLDSTNTLHLSPSPPPPSLEFTLVIPCYMESQRVTSTVRKCHRILSGLYVDSEFEIIFVNDGSTDDTGEVLENLLEECPRCRLLDLVRNYGKGFALKQGFGQARGKLVAFIDADGAPDFESIVDMIYKLNEIATPVAPNANQENNLTHGMVLGCRYSTDDSKTTKRRFFRHITSFGLRLAFCLVTGISGIRDSQCGFKLFTHSTASYLSTNMRVDRWATDIEILVLGSMAKIPIPFSEVAIDWNERLGGTFSALRGAVTIGRDLILIRLFYSLGFWKIQN